MARYHFHGRAVDTFGNIKPGAGITVYLTGTETAATVYANQSGGAAITTAPQVTTDTKGRFDFWLDDTVYIITQLFDMVVGDLTYTKVDVFGNVAKADLDDLRDRLRTHEVSAKGIFDDLQGELRTLQLSGGENDDDIRGRLRTHEVSAKGLFDDLRYDLNTFILPLSANTIDVDRDLRSVSGASVKNDLSLSGASLEGDRKLQTVIDTLEVRGSTSTLFNQGVSAVRATASGMKTNGNIYVNNQGDSAEGEIHIFADDDNDGGALYIYVGDNENGTINNYKLSAENADLLIGPNTDPDALIYDADNSRFLFTGAAGAKITKRLIAGNIQVSGGRPLWGFDTDETMAANSNNLGVTQRASKGYSDAITLGTLASSAHSHPDHGQPDTLYYNGEPTVRTYTDGIAIGDAGESPIFNNAANLFIRNEVHGGDIYLQAEDGGGARQTLYYGDPDGQSILYHNGKPRIETTTVGDGGIIVRDDNNQVCDFYHSGATFYIDSAVISQNIVIRGTDAGSGNSDMILCDPDGSVGLYYDGVLATSTTERGPGLKIVGALEVSAGHPLWGFDPDETMAANSNNLGVTQRASKGYSDSIGNDIKYDLNTFTIPNSANTIDVDRDLRSVSGASVSNDDDLRGRLFTFEVSARGLFDSLRGTIISHATSGSITNIETWNASDKDPQISLTEANMKATTTATSWDGVRAITGLSSGKYYTEINANSSSDMILGIAKGTSPLDYPGSDANGYGYRSNGDKYTGGVQTGSYGSPYNNGDVVGLAFDLNVGKISVSVNNVWQGGADPAAGTNPMFSGLSGIYYIMAGLYQSSQACTLNPGPVAEFAGTVPEGFVAVDSVGGSQMHFAQTNIDHTLLQNIGTRNHSQIDIDLDDTRNALNTFSSPNSASMADLDIIQNQHNTFTSPNSASIADLNDIVYDIHTHTMPNSASILYHSPGVSAVRATGLGMAFGHTDGTGSLFVAGAEDSVYLEPNSDGGHVYIRTGAKGSEETQISCLDDGPVGLYFDNALKCQTTSAGFGPSTGETDDLGTVNKEWRDVYGLNAYSVTSDERKKVFIKETRLGLDFINKLTPIEYQWIAGHRKHHGLGAQSVETVLDKIGVDTEDFGGFIYDPLTDNYSLRMGEFIAPMIKAIQEQQEIIIKLEKEIELLKELKDD